MRRFIKIVGGLFAVLLLLVVILFFTDFNAPWISKWLVETLARQAGVEMTVESARINFLRGIKLTGVDAKKERRSSTTTATADLLLLEHRLWPLLRGDIVIHRIELRSPQLEVVSSPGRPGEESGDAAREDAEAEQPEEIAPPPDTAETSRRDTTVAIGTLLLTDAQLILRTEGASQDDVVLRGLNLELADVHYDTAVDDALAALSGSGTLRAAVLEVDGRTYEEAGGELTIGDGRADLEGLTATGVAGSLTVERAAIDMNPDPSRYTLDLRIDPLDLNAILDTEPGTFGAGHLALSGSGSGDDWTQLSAEVNLTVEPGQVPAHPIFVRLDRVFGTSMAGAGYEITPLGIVVDEGQMQLAPFALTTQHLRLSAAGTAVIEGPLDLEISLAFRRDEVDVKEIPVEILDAFTDDGGWTALPLRVTGTLREPDLGADWDTIGSATRQAAKTGATKVVTRRAVDGLERFIDRREKAGDG